MRRFIALSALSLFAQPADAAEQDDLKAAIVFNIIRFTQFPAAAHGDLVLCVIAAKPVLKAFSQINGKSVNGGRLIVRPATGFNDIRAGCAVACVSNGTIVAGSEGSPLMIGDSPGFAARGGAVGLRQFGRQISFEVNPRVGKRQGVQFSSRLLNLAVVIRD